MNINAETINGVTYETVYLTGNAANNRSLIQSANATKNYRYVMTADWQVPEVFNFTGKNVILDLNGYNLVVNANYLGAYSEVLELTDSSPAQNGTIAGNSTYHIIFAFDVQSKKFIFSGGNILNGGMDAHVADVSVELCGGNVHSVFWQNMRGYFGSFTVPAYYQVTWWSSTPTVAVLYDYYAVSASPYVSGAYNTTSGYRWELSSREFLNLTLPDNQVYYLWARNADGAYTYLNARYDSNTKTWVTA